MKLEPNINKLDAINLIKGKIETETPFLFSRFGDGEMWLLKKDINSTRKSRVFMEWGVGESNYLDFIDRVNTDLIDAYNSCDLIGIMGDNYGNYGVSNIPLSLWSIDTETCEKIGLDVKDKFTDHLLCRSVEFGNPHNFGKLLNNKSIHIISPNTDILKTKNLPGILNCEVSFTKIGRNPNTVIHHKDELIETISKIEEKIVLFGVGAAGKYIGTHLRNNHDKICLDFGSTLDGWSNIRSRGWFNTTQQHLLIK